MSKDRKRGDEDEWRAEWKDMPEFIQEDLTSFRKIIVHFSCQEDVDAFAKLVGQHIGPKQPSIGFPQRVVRRYANKRYVDDSELPTNLKVRGF